MTRVSVGFLYAMCVLVWSTTWLAIKVQVAHASPEAGVAYRFLLASATIMLVYRLAGRPLRVPRAAHGRLVVQGLLLYCLDYILVYHAQTRLPSGLVAIGYSAAPVLGMALEALLVRRRFRGRTLAGGCLGILGIGLLFWQQLADFDMARPAIVGAVLVGIAVATSVTGSALFERDSGRIPVFTAMAWSMLYGGLASLVAASLSAGIGFDVTLTSAAALAYLAIPGSLLAFGAYLELVRRIGLARAAYTGILAQTGALALSAVVGEIEWHATMAVGVAICLGGNWFVLAESGTSPTAGATPCNEKKPAMAAGTR